MQRIFNCVRWMQIKIDERNNGLDFLVLSFVMALSVFLTHDVMYKFGGMTGGVHTRLTKVTGYDGRTNDVVYCHPKSPTSPNPHVVVYFGGDVQDFPENMESHRDNKHYIRWNLENVATMLQNSFPLEHIVVVRPARMEFKMFSCFDNFVPCDNTGAPDHTPNHYALQHLEQLLQGIADRIETQDGKKEKEGEGTLDKCRVILVGFSKGCVVLNQFLYEFHYLNTLTPDDDSMTDMVNRISDMYWLDGAHAGGKNTWVTSRSLLETLARLRIQIHIHVTPYQVNDERRPWIRKEEKAFGDLLHKLGAPVTRMLHFENQIPNLITHFELLSAFKQVST